MADTKLSALSLAVSSPTGTERIYLADGTVSKYITAANLKAYTRAETRSVVLGTTFNPGSATLQNVTGMSFSVLNGHYYLFYWFLEYRSSSLTVGPQFALTFPTGEMQAVLRAQATTANTVTVGLGFYESSFGVSGAAQTIPDVPATGTSMKCIIEGTLTPTADGTFQLQFANESGSTACTLRAASMGRIWDVT